MALISTASPPVSDPFHPTTQPQQPGSSDAAEDLGRRGQHSVLPTWVIWNWNSIYREMESYTALYMLKTKEEKNKQGSPLNSAFYG